MNKWKYGLSLDGLDFENLYDILGTEILEKYVGFLGRCHHAVEDYLNSYPEIQTNFKYFTVLKRVAPDWYDEISDLNKKIADYRTKHQDEMFNFMQSCSSLPISKGDKFVKEMCRF